VRIRIALSTATAVSITTAAFMTFLNGAPAASAKSTVEEPTSTVHHLTPLASTSLASFAAPETVNTASGPAVEVGGNPISTAAVGLSSTAPVPLPTPPAPVVPVVQNDANSPNTGDWLCIRIHESGDQYNNPGKPSGAYGILDSTWHDFGYSGWPYQASPAVQDALALKLYSLYGFHPWSSRFACGL
jgi:Transglycosylase-like domain